MFDMLKLHDTLFNETHTRVIKTSSHSYMKCGYVLIKLYYTTYYQTKVLLYCAGRMIGHICSSLLVYCWGLFFESDSVDKKLSYLSSIQYLLCKNTSCRIILREISVSDHLHHWIWKYDLYSGREGWERTLLMRLLQWDTIHPMFLS
jgi:hypothetical protein